MQFADRVKQTTATAGTGSYAISASVVGFATFIDSFADGAQIGYCAQSVPDYEVGFGTLSNNGLTLSRDTILSSSNGGNKVVWGDTDKDLFCTIPAVLVPVYSADDPTGSDNPPFVGAKHINMVSGEEFICIDNTVGANVWRGSGGWSATITRAVQSGDAFVFTIPPYC